MEETKKNFPKTVVPPHLEEVFYSVILHYPELADTYIFIHEHKFYGISHTLRAYPPLLSLGCQKKNRVHPIIINTDKNTPVLFSALSRDEQEGILAHELAHIYDYLKKNSLELMIFSLRFLLSQSFVKRIERETDETAIARGFGEKLKKYKALVFEKSKRSYELYRKVIYHGEKISGFRAFLFSVSHSFHTGITFLIALVEMMELKYIRKIHKRR